jgi:hypothetical protein
VLNSVSAIKGVRIVHQTENLGGTRNIVAVANLMTAEWGLWCGDDDEICEGSIKKLIEKLRLLEQRPWVLVETLDNQGQPMYTRVFNSKGYKSNQFRHALILNGLDSLGFMGVHVFPKAAVDVLNSMQLHEMQPWPHMAGLLRFITSEKTNILVLPLPVINQAGSGTQLFWTAGDLAKLHISKEKILHGCISLFSCHKWFFRLLHFHEVYSPQKLVLLFAWKIYENNSFMLESFQAYSKVWGRVGFLYPLMLPHIFLVVFLRLFPQTVLVMLLRCLGKGGYIARYEQRKSALANFNGMKRGI